MSQNTEPTAAPATPPGPEAPQAPATWEDLGLSKDVLEIVSKAGYTAPTPIQAKSIPLALDRYDLIASAQTGTGKTASFVLPMIDRFAGKEGTYGLILAPTREIALQIQDTIKIFGGPLGIRSCVLIGGVDYKIDAAALNAYPQIIVATPGRLCDHLDRGNVWLEFIQMVVLDEADRMLDMGFSDQLNRIMSEVPDRRQTLLFSATFSAPVEKLARKIMYEPERIAIGRPTATASTVEQSVLWVMEEDKNRELRRLIRNETGSIIVFARSKDKATRIWRSLHSNGYYDATYIHSDRLQSHREQALNEFREGKYRILIATDVAGRGIHVDGVAHVINFDLPMEPEDYVHRIGRTGRAEMSGKATSFVTPMDRGKLKEILALVKREIPEKLTDGYPKSKTLAGGSGDSDRGSSYGGRGGGGSGGGGRSHRSHGGRPSGGSSSGGPGGGGGGGGGGRRPRRGGRGGSGGGGPSGGGRSTGNTGGPAST
ncbi:MAG: DEAD/DEAH box helicase [Bdellovibrionales bacterium]|nr:DEAD/DEAH box helicase [Bdellovibrionales bacterium]